MQRWRRSWIAMTTAPIRRHASLPLPLPQPGDAADHEIGTQAAPVVAEGRDGAIRGHEQGKDVEAHVAVAADEVRSVATGVQHVACDIRRRPRPAVDQLARRWVRASRGARAGAGGCGP